MRISDWSSDVCSSDLLFRFIRLDGREERQDNGSMTNAAPRIAGIELGGTKGIALIAEGNRILDRRTYPTRDPETTLKALTRSEEHTSELQSLMRISYAVFCLKNRTILITST